jgi:hypothetical protein
MRLSGFVAIVVLGLAVPAFGQTIDVKSANQSGKGHSPSPSRGAPAQNAPANNPAFRPVVLGTGPDSLVNRIDTAALIKGGQKDGLVMFTCLVDKTGKMVESAVYRPSANSDQLQKELKRRLVDATFTPAIYNHAPVDAVYYGTLSFVVVQGKPRLRIFSNQEYPELQKESDFVGPEPMFGGESKFSGLHYPPAAAAQVPVSGIADIRVKVDDKGNLEWMGVIGEHPPLIGFGAQGLLDLDGTKFIPAFRDGKPVECEITLPLYYPEP